MFEVVIKTVVIAFILHGLIKEILPSPIRDEKKKIEHPTDFAGTYSFKEMGSVSATGAGSSMYLLGVVALPTEIIQQPEIIERIQTPQLEHLVSLSYDLTAQSSETSDNGDESFLVI